MNMLVGAGVVCSASFPFDRVTSWLMAECRNHEASDFGVYE